MIRTLTARDVAGIQCYSPDVAQDYTDYPDAGFDVTDDTAATSFWVGTRNRLFSWLVHRELRRLGRARLLDVGCGTGDFAQHLVKDGTLTVTGSEIYLKGLHFAKKRQPGVEFIQYDVTEGVLDRGFDIITAFDVFEHIDRDVDGMRHVHQMLSPEGVFVISVPQHMFLWSRLDEIVCHKRRYSRAEMVAKLRATGFAPVRVTSHVFALFPLMALSRLLDRARGAAPQAGGDELSDRVTFSPLVNWVFDKVMYLDEALIKLGLSLPFGGTLVVVARKSGSKPG
ncbi:class I SAM-dependent methyltransferase [Rhodobacter sp. KR11]|uniref:class I SAM-dependent methyltransferase n=1 Tax=Rhodobacter sp. KR11 TaxID=2974588 RepID=UPI00222366C5|nr:class I SAM-dependent methyltransferase [Rhodobacter sp. KR11]MCW1918553.1 class I SAM-dependent methyltransferase [Rhodobacter sp. KR11]